MLELRAFVSFARLRSACLYRMLIYCPYIIEEEESEIPMSFEQSVPEQILVRNTKGLTIGELPSFSKNQERSLLLLNPVNTPLVPSPSNFLIFVNLDLLSGLKSGGLWGS